MCITAFLIPRLRITGIFGALFTVVALAFVNSTLWSTALFFQVPDHFTTHAAFLFIANGLIFWILVKILPGIEVKGFLPAFAAPIVFTLCSMVIAKYGDKVPWSDIWELTKIVFAKGKTYFDGPQATPAPHGH